jgi:hypothetical protein
VNPTPAQRRRWDGTRGDTRPHRTLRLDQGNQTRLLRAAQTRPCPSCGNRVEWYYRSDGSTIALHPHELPTEQVPEHLRWHLHRGTAFPTGDGTPWCRIAHPPLCPAREHEAAARLGRLATLRRDLALNTRALLDNGHLPPPGPLASTGPGPHRPTGRHLVHLLQALYLAPGRVQDLRCVAQSIRRNRCPHTLIDPAQPPGTWALLPIPSAPARGHLPEHLTGTPMAVYDLSHLPSATQLRWHRQHCTAHASSLAGDIALTDWETFDVTAHHQHITPALPGDDERRTAP